MPDSLPRTASVVVTTDEAVQDAVLAAAAAAGEPVDVIADPRSVLPVWASAGAVFIGADCAGHVARLGLPLRERVHLIGSDPADLARWSLDLGAVVAVLPDAVDLLGAAVTGGADARTPVIALVGAAGGAGTSTLVVGLALLARRPTLVVDADPDGGGLDLALGLEAEPGWRWPDLGKARGHLGSLRGQVPRLDEVDVVSIGRQPTVDEPPPEAVAAVVGSARRSHELVVIDAGRGRGATAVEALRLANLILVVTTAEVRAVAATDRYVRELRARHLPVHGVLVRARRGSGIGGHDIGAAVGAPVWATIPDDAGVAAAGRRGGPPDRAAGRRWRRACAEVLRRVAR